MRQQILAAVILLSILPLTTGHTASFTPLGDLDGGAFESDAYGVSADGTVVGGYATTAVGGEATRWTNSAGIWTASSIAGGHAFTAVYGVTPDGAVMVGRANGLQPYRWTAGTAMVTLPGSFTGGQAYGVSADGGVIVGYGNSPLGIEAFRWTAATGMVGLGGLGGTSPNGFATSLAQGVSADGSIVFGGAWSPTALEAFRWSASSGMVGLGHLPGLEMYSAVYGASADGSVMAGISYTNTAGEAFRWTQQTGMVRLAQLQGFTSSFAEAVSGDGSIIVGSVQNGAGAESVVWNQSTGVQRLFDVLVAGGASGMDGWVLSEIRAISADGTWVVGNGLNPDGQKEAFVANITPVPVPAVGWLLAPAFGVLGWRRRRALHALG